MQLVAIIAIIAVGIIFLMPSSNNEETEEDDFTPVSDLTSPALEDMYEDENCPPELRENEVIRLRMAESRK